MPPLADEQTVDRHGSVSGQSTNNSHVRTGPHRAADNWLAASEVLTSHQDIDLPLWEPIGVRHLPKPLRLLCLAIATPKRIPLPTSTSRGVATQLCAFKDPLPVVPSPCPGRGPHASALVPLAVQTLRRNHGARRVASDPLSP